MREERLGRRRGIVARLGVCAVVGLSAMVATACGSSSSTGSTASPPATTTAAASSGGGNSCTQQAQAAVDKARAQIPVQGPSQPLNISSLKGKKIYFINLVDNPNNEILSKGFVAAAKAAGVNGVATYANGTASDWNKQVQDAISQGANAIVLHGIQPQIVSGPVQQAEAAHITVTDVENGQPNAPLELGLKGHVSENWDTAGEDIVNWMLADSKCHANVLLLTTDVLTLFNPLKARTQGITSQCPACKATVDNVDLANLATAVGPQAVDALQRDSSINYIQTAFDAQLSFVVPAVQSQFPHIKIVSHDGIPLALSLIRKGSVVKMTVANPPGEFIGWCALDSVMRAMLGKPQDPNTTTVPGRVVDQTNVGASDAAIWPGWSSFPTLFEKAWGVKS